MLQVRQHATDQQKQALAPDPGPKLSVPRLLAASLTTPQRSRRDGWFEVIAGKAVPAQGQATCFGYVETYDSKPKRRLFEVLKAHGMQENQQVTFLTDGGEDIRELSRFLNPQAEHLLDWFHITMRITVMTNMVKSLRPPPPDPDLELSTETATKLITESWTVWGVRCCTWSRWAPSCASAGWDCGCWSRASIPPPRRAGRCSACCRCWRSSSVS